jgi:hypothetical protein
MLRFEAGGRLRLRRLASDSSSAPTFFLPSSLHAPPSQRAAARLLVIRHALRTASVVVDPLARQPPLAVRQRLGTSVRVACASVALRRRHGPLGGGAARVVGERLGPLGNVLLLDNLPPRCRRRARSRGGGHATRSGWRGEDGCEGSSRGMNSTDRVGSDGGGGTLMLISAPSKGSSPPIKSARELPGFNRRRRA